MPRRLTGAAPAEPRRPLKLIVLPRVGNPYQRLLYGELCREGDAVRYAGELTGSHTLNLLLLPLELAGLRARGWRILHLHWTFAFRLTGSDRLPALRHLAQLWFGLVLGLCRMLGIRLVWTAHNVLPHEPSFANEPAARRLLVRRADLVLAHSPAALAGLAEIGARPRRSAIVVHGTLSPGVDPADLRTPGSDGPPLRLLFVGQVLEYKGVEDLLAALAELPADVAIELTVAGHCRDGALAERLREHADRVPHAVTLRLEFLGESELTAVLAGADVIVLPFRRVTTSGSVLLAMGHGRPVVVPAAAAFAEIPEDAVVRYDGTVPGLTATLRRLATADPAELARIGAAAARYAAGQSWSEAAAQTRAAIEALG